MVALPHPQAETTPILCIADLYAAAGKVYPRGYRMDPWRYVALYALLPVLVVVFVVSLPALVAWWIVRCR